MQPCWASNCIDLRHIERGNSPVPGPRPLPSLRQAREADQSGTDNRIAQSPAARELRQGLVLFCCQAFELLDRDEVTAEIFRAEKGANRLVFPSMPAA
jgi:hypothetical protein